ncbi:hypothetical protein FE257_003392 [Aspergillus nanangensis]|uniref:NTP binding protein n=1 Tax=Aspergillus nanangensis TaxID=2582783 RepID=A0AAD4CD21_ASPNN|nr:hypothetical protein FE257_003392 [Aspergillus nanangensis]
MSSNVAPQQSARDLDDEEDVDALLESLENEDDSAYRAQRVEQLNAEFASAKNNRSVPTTTIVEDGLYPTLNSDQVLLDITTQINRCVIHFAHPDFARCATMDDHMRELATHHHEVRFARADVRNTPFIVEKLKIRVLPCVIGFKDGIAVERVLGFEGIGLGGNDGTNGISTTTLEKRLLLSGILAQSRFKAKDDDSDFSDPGSDEEQRGGGRRTIRSGRARIHEDDDDDDWD